jgi:hypothetical protein
MYIFSLIILLSNIVISIITSFSSLSIYGVLGSMMAVIFCNESLNREEIIEIIMRSNTMLLFSNENKRIVKRPKGKRI